MIDVKLLSDMIERCKEDKEQLSEMRTVLRIMESRVNKTQKLLEHERAILETNEVGC